MPTKCGTASAIRHTVSAVTVTAVRPGMWYIMSGLAVCSATAW